MSASDRPVVITGTSGGLGAAIARAVLAEGRTVVGVSRREVGAESLGATPLTYRHVAWDLGDLDHLKALADRIIADHGKPFALVNNAAVGRDGLLPTMHNRDIEDVVRVNVTSPMVLTKYLVRPMLAARSGRIVNISSVVARTGYRGLSAYGATKAAMEGFTRSLARDLGPRGVTVNAVAPGFMETEMTGGLGAENLATIARRSALGRFADPSEVAAAVVLLLSDAGAGITGTVVTVDAGSTA